MKEEIYKEMDAAFEEAKKLSLANDSDIVICQHSRSGDFYFTEDENSIGSNDSPIAYYNNGEQTLL